MFRCERAWLDVKDGAAAVPYRCGRCAPCRSYRAAVWTHRLWLEHLSAGRTAYVTLTYHPERLVYRDSHNPTLVMEDMQLFLKRLRKRMGDEKLRYYYCGEYGKRNNRPHYHALLFGYPGCTNSHYKGLRSYFDENNHCCPSCDKVFLAWNLPQYTGHVGLSL